jgi:hypothetical protein
VRQQGPERKQQAGCSLKAAFPLLPGANIKFEGSRKSTLKAGISGWDDIIFAKEEEENVSFFLFLTSLEPWSIMFKYLDVWHVVSVSVLAPGPTNVKSRPDPPI